MLDAYNMTNLTIYKGLLLKILILIILKIMNCNSFIDHILDYNYE